MTQPNPEHQPSFGYRYGTRTWTFSATWILRPFAAVVKCQRW